MAEERKVLLKVELDVNQLKKNSKEAEKALELLVIEQKKLKDANKQGTLEYKANQLAIAENNKALKDNARALATSEKAQKTTTGSLNEMKALLSAATFAYNNLSKAERENSKEGQQLKKDIKGLSDELKVQESAVGNNTRNVGNYSSALGGMGGAAGAAVGGISRLTASMKLFLLNPVVLVVTAIVGAFLALKKAFTTTEEGQNRLGKATKVISTLFQSFFDLIEPIASFIVDVFVAALDGLAAAFEWVTDKMGDFLELLGLDTIANGVRGIGDATAELIAKTEKLEDVKNKADKKERKLIVERAKMETKIAELREKAAKKDEYSAAQRVKFLKEAGDITDELFKKEENLAKTRFIALQQENKLTNTSKEGKKEEAEAEAALIRLSADRAKSSKKIAAELVTTSREAKSEEQRILKERNDNWKKAEDERIAISNRIASLILSNVDLTVENEKKAQEAKYKYLEQVAEGNLLELLSIEGRRVEELNALTDKEKENELAKLDAKYKDEVSKAKNNAEILKLLKEQNQKEIAKIEIDFNTQKEARENESLAKQVELIEKDRLLQEQKIENQRGLSNRLKMIQGELMIQLNKGTKEEIEYWRKQQDERIRQAEENAKVEAEKYKEGSDERKAIEVQLQIDILAIKEESFNKEKVLDQQKNDNLAKQTTSALSSAQALSDSLFQIKQNQIQAELNAVQEQYSQESDLLKQQLDANLISQAEYDAQKSKLDAEAQAKEKKLKEKAFKAQKTSQLISAAINTATGITAALSAGPAGIALAAVAAVLGAAQIAIIASQPTPKFERGGNPIQSGTFGGKSHASGGTRGVFEDGTQIEVEKDENFYILNKRSSAMINRLSHLNQMGGGVPLAKHGAVMKFATGGAFASQASSGADSRFQQENSITEYISKMPRPVVLVEDINGAQGTLSDVESRANW